MIGAFLPRLTALLQQTQVKAAQARMQQAMQAPPGAAAGPVAHPPAMPQPMAAHPMMPNAAPPGPSMPQQ
jgi:hypothetical protein